MIVLDNFRGHDMAGITVSGKNFFGSIDRPCCPDLFCCTCDTCNECGEPYGNWCPAGMHEWIDVQTMPMGSYSPLVDLLGHDSLAANALVILTDGLYGGPTEQPDSFPCPFLSDPFNNYWSCSVFASQDPIAMDSVVYDILRNEPNVPYAHTGCIDNYMHEAALADKPPSGTVYNPTGKHVLSSLGTHEHWNNNKDRQYSRNLGTGAGIELKYQLLN
eukprot:TRINITY_DN657_c0_g1_i9.p1 TRINITY_DN657_c0_g1~~TRINITY_DN657_c0_g1_i9.p1  ORF type:complete len:217 (+),score=49.61 TRINITY_DN657_c0_g1_i9:166-816(+)